MNLFIFIEMRQTFDVTKISPLNDRNHHNLFKCHLLFQILIKLVINESNQTWNWTPEIKNCTSISFILMEMSFKKDSILNDKYLNGSDSWPSRGLLFGLFARGHPDKLRCDE